MNKQFVQKTAMVLGILLVLATMPVMSAQSDEKYKITAEKTNVENNAFRLADSLKDFDLVTFKLDPDAFNKSVNDKRTVLLTLGEEELELELHQTYVMAKDTKVIVEDEKGIHYLEAPYFHTYHGEVTGKNDSKVAITTGDDMFIGMIDIDDDPYYIELVNKTINGRTVHAVYRDSDKIFDPDAKPAYCGVDDEDVNTTNVFSAEKIGTLASRSTTEIEMLPCYDRDFKDIYGSYSEAQAEISDMINEVNLALGNHDVELTFSYYKRYAYLDDNSSQGMINFFKQDIPPYRDITDSDLAAW